MLTSLFPLPLVEQDYLDVSQYLKTILDFYRFGLSIADSKKIYLGHGTASYEDEVLSLILGSLNLPMDWPESYWTSRLTLDERKFLSLQFYRRFEFRIPTPYLTHKAFFCGLAFYVDDRVLIPRSPLAELIEQQFMPWVEPEAVLDILDLCTGSACIAAACAYAFPEARVDAIDICPKALAVAALNLEKLDLQDQVRLIESDGLTALSQEKYDIIVSNPPYVGAMEMASLPAEYLHEPKAALESEDDGLSFVKMLLKKAKSYLKPKGILVVEVGNSDLALMAACPDLPFIWLEFERGGHGVFLLHAEDLV
jgi:ribosomal protein L3 glutamine methyltransferase